MSTMTTLPSASTTSLAPFGVATGVPELRRQKSVKKCLNTTRALGDPGYAHAVLESYVSSKLRRGRSKFQVSNKLEGMERRMPHFAPDFRAVRRILDLPDSGVLPTEEHAPPPPYTGKRVCTCGAADTDDTDDGATRTRVSVVPVEVSSGASSRGASPERRSVSPDVVQLAPAVAAS